MTGNPTGVLPLSQGSATAVLLPSGFATSSRGGEATVFGFLSWRMVTAQGSAPPQEHQEPSSIFPSHTSVPELGLGGSGRSCLRRLLREPARESEGKGVPTLCPLTGSLCCVWAPAWLAQTAVSIGDVFSGGAITHSPGESQLQPRQRPS